MIESDTFWRQLHELSDTVDRHRREGPTVADLTSALRDLPLATVQNRQRELHLLSRLFAGFTHFRGSKGWRAQPTAAQSALIRDAQELATSSSELEDDGSPASRE